MQNLSPQPVAVALLQPQIAPNTGNIARLCVATGVPLHLVRPMGFVLSDKQLKRSAMDYWPRLQMTLHDSTEAFFSAQAGRETWLFDSTGEQGLWEVSFAPGDMLVFGSETRGIDPAVLNKRAAQTVRIPQIAGERCLNLSTSVGIVLYECIRQLMQNGQSGSKDRKQIDNP